MKFELTSGQSNPESAISSALVDESYNHFKGGSDSRVSRLDPLEGLDSKTRDIFDQTLATITDLAQTVKNMPADVRNQFLNGIGSMEGPAYDLFRKTLTA